MMASRSDALPGSGTEDGPHDVLWEDGERRYCRAWKEIGGGHREVVIARPAAAHQTAGAISRFGHEYRLKEHLDHSWALRPLELVGERAQTLLVLEWTPARPLDQTVGPGVPIEVFLQRAIAVANAIAGMHQSGIIHKD